MTSDIIRHDRPMTVVMYDGRTHWAEIYRAASGEAALELAKAGIQPDDWGSDGILSRTLRIGAMAYDGLPDTSGSWEEDCGIAIEDGDPEDPDCEVARYWGGPPPVLLAEEVMVFEPECPDVTLMQRRYQDYSLFRREDGEEVGTRDISILPDDLEDEVEDYVMDIAQGDSERFGRDGTMRVLVCGPGYDDDGVDSELHSEVEVDYRIGTFPSFVVRGLDCYEPRDEPAWEILEVRGSGGGVKYVERDVWTGLERHTDTWCRSEIDGTEGHTDVWFVRNY